MISFYTLTLGREFYLKKLIASMQNSCNGDYEHYIAFQGCEASDELREIINADSRIKPLFWQENCGAGEGNNKVIQHLKGDIVAKLDDDALIHSKDYDMHIKAIMDIGKNNIVISPYPVGLINNPGGVPKKAQHEVGYSKETNTYYTFRPVDHIGGFARVAPAHIVKKFQWPYDLSTTSSGSEDSNFSAHCRQNGIRLFYMENSIVVEHQESTLGQHVRDENYFKGRF